MKENLEEIRKKILSCERLYYFGVCVLKENRILKRVLSDLSKISWKMVKNFSKGKFKNEKEIVEFFIENYLLSILKREEIKNFVEILKFNRMHEESSLEFVRKERLIVYYAGKYEIITKEKIVKGLNVVKKILQKIEN